MAITGDVLEGDTATDGTIVIERIKRIGRRIISLAWTCTAGGAVTANITALSGTLMRVVTNPGATAPTDDYDITLKDQDGLDILAGGGANRDTANTEEFTPFGTDATFGTPMVFDGDLALAITTAGASKEGVLRLYIKPEF